MIRTIEEREDSAIREVQGNSTLEGYDFRAEQMANADRVWSAYCYRNDTCPYCVRFAPDHDEHRCYDLTHEC